MWLDEFLAPFASEAYRYAVIVGGAIAGTLASIMGEHLIIFWWLFAFVTTDWLTGVLAACLTGTASSKTGLIGICKKLLILVVGVCFHGLDHVLGISLICTWAVGALCINELLSILENIERAGFGSIIPPIVRHVINQVKEQQELAIKKKLGVEK